MSDWIERYGSYSPVGNSCVVDVKFRNGLIIEGRLAGELSWLNMGVANDIIAYRIVSQDIPEDFGKQNQKQSMHEKYPAYYKDVSHLTSIDVYRVHRLFEVNDPVIHHASKKLLMAGSRTGEKFEIDDIREARDSLSRWLDMAEEDKEGLA